jgi:hypothetical protein
MRRIFFFFPSGEGSCLVCRKQCCCTQSVCTRTHLLTKQNPTQCLTLLNCRRGELRDLPEAVLLHSGAQFACFTGTKSTNTDAGGAAERVLAHAPALQALPPPAEAGPLCILLRFFCILLGLFFGILALQAVRRLC